MVSRIGEVFECCVRSEQRILQLFASSFVRKDLGKSPQQRMGRIDRLGQLRPKVRILNFAYKDTVEADVLFAVRERIQLFQGIVRRLQPMLSKLPRRFEEVTLTSRGAREAAQQRFLAEIEQEVAHPDEVSLDPDEVAGGDLEPVTTPAPADDLAALDQPWCTMRLVQWILNGDRSTAEHTRRVCLVCRSRSESRRLPMFSRSLATVISCCRRADRCFANWPVLQMPLRRRTPTGICWLLHDQQGNPATTAPYPIADWPG
jgi:hypothetical protein